MHLIDAQGEIIRLRPNEFHNEYQYLVRLRPDIKMKSWSLARTGITLRKDLVWIGVSAQVARVLAHYSETGRTFSAMRYTPKARNLRPLVDIATCKEDADRIEQLYDLDKRQMMPGTTAQPHQLARTVAPDARQGLADIERMLGIGPVRYDARYERPKFGPSMQSSDSAPVNSSQFDADLAALQGVATPDAPPPAPPEPDSASRPKRPTRKSDRKSDADPSEE